MNNKLLLTVLHYIRFKFNKKQILTCERVKYDYHFFFNIKNKDFEKLDKLFKGKNIYILIETNYIIKGVSLEVIVRNV
jgi:hypothetical protein